MREVLLLWDVIVGQLCGLLWEAAAAGQSAHEQSEHILCDSSHTTFCHDNIDQRNKTKFMWKALCIFILCKIMPVSATYNVRLSLFFRNQKQVSYLRMRKCETPLFKKIRTWTFRMLVSRYIINIVMWFSVPFKKRPYNTQFLTLLRKLFNAPEFILNCKNSGLTSKILKEDEFPYTSLRREVFPWRQRYKIHPKPLQFPTTGLIIKTAEILKWATILPTCKDSSNFKNPSIWQT